MWQYLKFSRIFSQTIKALILLIIIIICLRLAFLLFLKTNSNTILIHLLLHLIVANLKVFQIISMNDLIYIFQILIVFRN